MSQIKDEIFILLKLLLKERPREILEIGTAEGGTLFLFSRVADMNAMLISVDMPGGPFGGGYPAWKIPLYKSFAWERQNIKLIRADSHNPETFEAVKKTLSYRSLDFLFIDGDHSYEGVKSDFEMYAKLVRRGGIVALHDIVPHPPETGCEVNKFWEEIKDKYHCLEIVKNWTQEWGGIGVIYVE